MHPDLLPFALDSTGNRFCLIVSGDQRDADEFAVAYWMYETYLAVPIASSFERFLDWIGLASELAVQRRTDPVIDNAHVQQVVRPLLAALGIERDYFALSTSPQTPVGSLHLGMMRLDPASPAARLVAARRAANQNRFRDALRHARAALDIFPDFVACAWFMINLPEAEQRVRDYDLLLREMASMSLIYRGDTLMPLFADVPQVDPRDAAEAVARRLRPGETDEDPALALAAFDDPLASTDWLRAAIDVANLGEYTRATRLATNAHHLSGSGIERRDALLLLEELYDALGWSHHRAVVAFELGRADD